nr:MAG TPA: hypothetical protein [Caudoviricetes sp.]
MGYESYPFCYQKGYHLYPLHCIQSNYTYIAAIILIRYLI